MATLISSGKQSTERRGSSGVDASCLSWIRLIAVKAPGVDTLPRGVAD